MHVPKQRAKQKRPNLKEKLEKCRKNNTHKRSATFMTDDKNYKPLKRTKAALYFYKSYFTQDMIKECYSVSEW